ncbi:MULTISPECIES: hypothetical protein [Bacillaceae]|uniref:Sporulation protein YtfJ n=1 Tax=Evansella alkalicola TaxID=745819 RepID=A0ABS6JUV1_9BACI|nr:MULTISPECIES: hypothetical protein [Bacillaceae]MBU9722200.1 hypothetical protein [Bacillus alkalicola]
MEKDFSEKRTNNSVKQENEQYAIPITPVFNKFSKQSDVSLVYGEEIECDGKKVVPVAKLRYMLGGGGGLSRGNAGVAHGEGGGGGGYFTVSPMGVYEITSEKTTFKPTLDLKFVLVLASVFTLGLAWIIKKGIEKRK